MFVLTELFVQMWLIAKVTPCAKLTLRAIQIHDSSTLDKLNSYMFEDLKIMIN